jgi:hypothetical protein
MKNIVMMVVLIAALVGGGVLALQAAMATKPAPAHACAHCKVNQSKCCKTPQAAGAVAAHAH